jgi:hypothetical protein
VRGNSSQQPTIVAADTGRQIARVDSSASPAAVAITIRDTVLVRVPKDTGLINAPIALSVIAVAVSLWNTRFNVKAFNQNRRRAVYNSLVTSVALEDVPSCADAVEALLKDWIAKNAGVFEDTTSQGVARTQVGNVSKAAREIISLVHAKLSCACQAWGDYTLKDQVDQLFVAWSDKIAEALNKMISSNGDIVPVQQANRQGQADVLRVIVEVERKDV